MNEKSSLYEKVEPECIERILLEKLGIKEKVQISPLSGGMFNTTYEASWEGGHVILRFGPVNRHLIMGFEQHLMEAEAQVYKLCENAGISCPCVLVCDTSRKLLNRDYMITEYVSGEVMSRAELSEEEQALLFQQMGAYASGLHEIVGDRFGFVSRLVSDKASHTWSQCLIREAEDILQRLEKTGGLTAEETGVFRKVFTANQQLLDEIRVPRLLHTDVWSGNVIFSRENGTLRIKMIIDGDRAVFGDEDFEWAAPWMNIPELFRGACLPDEGFYEEKRVMRRRIYLLFYCLLECYVGIGEYNDLDLYRKKREEALAVLKEIQLCSGD
ncbi:aminoglycoside phosphotransferase family protein [Blautia schinkii]|nr:aminoglycoside phosphotransferase family protein [Blautia schinkii]